VSDIEKFVRAQPQAPTTKRTYKKRKVPNAGN
jgi:hypothetical protein